MSPFPLMFMRRRTGIEGCSNQYGKNSSVLDKKLGHSIDVVYADVFSSGILIRMNGEMRIFTLFADGTAIMIKERRFCLKIGK